METSKINDFGAKIGGARKDMSITRNKKSNNEDTPQWVRAYRVITEEPKYISKISNFHNAGTGEFMLIWQDLNKSYRSLRLIASGFESEAEALAFISAAEALRTLRIYGYNEKFSIYRVFSTGKRMLIKDSLPSMDAAKYHIISNAAELIKRTVEKFGMPHLEKVERVGPDHRAGVDCTPSHFTETFGFRGVEFGNWVPDHERREILNFSFDAFMDLADVLGVDPKLISLGGQLSAAFGSRGTSEALAHYEPDYFVFNLTRMKGAGSLAHEWFHAFDNYRAGLILNNDFARVDGSAELIRPVVNFATEKLTNKQSSEIDAFYFLSSVMTSKKELKPVVIADYIKEIEKSRARLSEELNKITESLKNEIKDYSGKIRRGGKPATDAQINEFKSICARIIAGEIGEYKFFGSYKTGGYYYTCLEELSKIYKAVRNRSGLTAGGTLVNLCYYIRSFDQALERYNKIKDVKEIEVSVKTNFMKEAEKMDASRAQPYWAKVMEMGARAFAAYVDDRLSAAGRKNDYLVRSTDNTYYKMVSGVEVFPEAEERDEINKAFNDLFFAVSGCVSKLPMPVQIIEEPELTAAPVVVEISAEPEPTPAPLEVEISDIEIISYDKPKISEVFKPAPIINNAPMNGEKYHTSGSTVNFEIVDYSEKAIAVFGDTKTVKEKLKSLGGKFNGRLKRGTDTAAGWIFSKKKETELRDFLFA